MYILGINCVYHESSACIIRDGVVLAAAEEERFNRRKHGKEARADNPDELPHSAIAFCLHQAGIVAADVAHVACAGDPDEVRRVRDEGRPSPWNSADKQDLFLSSLPNVPLRLRDLGFVAPFHWVPHHTAHAASAYYVSPYQDAGVLVVDALGDDAFSTRLFAARGERLEALQDVRFPASIGYLWELFSVFLGFGVYDAAKVMGLAAYGDPARFREALDALAWPTADGGFAMAHDRLRFSDICYYPPSADCVGLEATLGVRPRSADEPLTDVHHDIAAALQSKTNELVFHMVRHLHTLTGSSNLCLAGGVALNCVTNRQVFEDGPFSELYIQAAAHDGGLALGAASYVWGHILGRTEREVMKSACIGPAFSDAEIERELEDRGLIYDRCDDIEPRVARLVSEGRVVGFFQEGMEFGPRALGSRSIVADPRRADMRDILNRKVKHREYFRPLAPSVLQERAEAWFEIGRETLASDFMLLAYPARMEVRDRIPAVLHEDGTCRVQTVRQDACPSFHRLIRAFEDLTGVPMVLNTSFNDQEPIICSPSDAITTFMKTEIDYLAIGPFLLDKGRNPPAAASEPRGVEVPVL